MKVRNVVHAAFPVAEYKTRYEKLQKVMDKRNLDAILVTAKENVVYFSGLETVGWDSKHRPIGCILPREKGKPVLVVAESLVNVADVTSWIDDVRLWGGFKRKGIPNDPVVGIADAIKDLGLAGGRIGMEMGYGTRINMSQADFEMLKGLLPEMEVVDAAEAIWELRMIKSPSEIEAMRKVCMDTCTAYETAFAAMRGGMTERELAGILLAEFARLTTFRPGFVGIRSGKLKYGMMNVPPFENKKLESGDLVVVDAGATNRDYWCGMMVLGFVGGQGPRSQA